MWSLINFFSPSASNIEGSKRAAITAITAAAAKTNGLFLERPPSTPVCRRQSEDRDYSQFSSAFHHYAAAGAGEHRATSRAKSGSNDSSSSSSSSLATVVMAWQNVEKTQQHQQEQIVSCIKLQDASVGTAPPSRQRDQNDEAEAAAASAAQAPLASFAVAVLCERGQSPRTPEVYPRPNFVLGVDACSSTSPRTPCAVLAPAMRAEVADAITSPFPPSLLRPRNNEKFLPSPVVKETKEQSSSPMAPATAETPLAVMFERKCAEIERLQQENNKLRSAINEEQQHQQIVPAGCSEQENSENVPDVEEDIAPATAAQSLSPAELGSAASPSGMSRPPHFFSPISTAAARDSIGTTAASLPACHNRDDQDEESTDHDYCQQQFQNQHHQYHHQHHHHHLQLRGRAASLRERLAKERDEISQLHKAACEVSNEIDVSLHDLLETDDRRRNRQADRASCAAAAAPACDIAASSCDVSLMSIADANSTFVSPEDHRELRRMVLWPASSAEPKSPLAGLDADADEAHNQEHAQQQLLPQQRQFSRNDTNNSVFSTVSVAESLMTVASSSRSADLSPRPRFPAAQFGTIEVFITAECGQRRKMTQQERRQCVVGGGDGDNDDARDGKKKKLMPVRMTRSALIKAGAAAAKGTAAAPGIWK